MLAPETATAFIDLALERLATRASALGDRVSIRPDLADANSAFGIVTHCVAVCTFWLDHVVLGRDLVRDRDAEFDATGTAGDLETLVADQRARLPELLAAVAATEEPAHDLGEHVPWPWTIDAIVLHVIEELFQHLGHVDLTVDLLDAAR